MANKNKTTIDNINRYVCDFLTFFNTVKTCANPNDGVAIGTMSLPVAITEITAAIRSSSPTGAYQKQSGGVHRKQVSFYYREQR